MQRNLNEHLLRATVPPNERQKRNVQGMFKSGQQCTACPDIKEGKSIKLNKLQWNTKRKFNFESRVVIYLIECQKEKNINKEDYRYINEI